MKKTMWRVSAGALWAAAAWFLAGQAVSARGPGYDLCAATAERPCYVKILLGTPDNSFLRIGESQALAIINGPGVDQGPDFSDYPTAACPGQQERVMVWDIQSPQNPSRGGLVRVAKYSGVCFTP